MNPNEASANKTYNITTLGITQIAIPANPAGKLVMIGILIATKGSSSNIAKIYDSANTEENLVGTLDTVNNTGFISLPRPFYNGIRIVTSAGTQADLVIVYAETP